MKANNEKISSNAFAMTIACFLMGSTLLISHFGDLVKQDAWIVVIISALLCLILISLYSALLKSYPGDNLPRINEKILGKWGGKIINILYLWFFINLASLSFTDLGDFINLTMLQETPKIAILISFVGLCAYALRKGLQVFTSYSGLMVILTMAYLIISVILAINYSNPANMLPILAQPPQKYLQSIHTLLAFPFGEIIAFAVIADRLKTPENVKKCYHMGLLFGFIVIFTLVIRNYLVLGHTDELFLLPSFEALRIVNLSETLNRMETIFSIVFIMLLLVKASVLYYVVLIMLKDTFGLESFQPLILVTGALLMIISIYSTGTAKANMVETTNSVPFIWITFELVIPLGLFIFIKVKALFKRKEAV